ncbi:dienelactone hydrolase family protein [Blastococcus haudaquaticus]|uniref:Carboxymethylenebutenolidase n=1 Tax=Blastococcus haudaquaticus TaxID=1938745 RepID=A0A286GV10_9ACTN|nr:dienelactone hydrolase family protein [Blastococcus haudaquaticus]SOD99407.1 carboxymethylenebutenolidase [Blastococcus haudaquaticus]
MPVQLVPHDSGVRAGWVHFPSGEDLVRGYLALPAQAGDLPLVITAHENLGVTVHRQEVTRRLAAEGFASLTVDMFSRVGGMPPQNFVDADDRRSKAFLAARDEVVVPDLQAGLEFAAELPEVDGARVGALGFCLGGGSVLAWAAQTDDLAAVVSLYGIPVLPPEYSPTGSERSRLPLLAQLRAPVQFHFGGADEAIPADQIDALEAALPSSATPAELFRYEGAGHAYHDDTHPNHHAEAADLTWKRTVGFLREHLA